MQFKLIKNYKKKTIYLIKITQNLSETQHNKTTYDLRKKFKELKLYYEINIGRFSTAI